MMRFAIDNDGLFGLSYRADADVGRETAPEIGSIGCLAKVNAVMPLDDGKMNLVCVGVVRYRVRQLKQLAPFMLASVELFKDDVELTDEVEDLFEEVKQLCMEFLKSAGIVDDSGTVLEKNLPDDAESFSLVLASLLPIETDLKQSLLEMTSTRMRLTRLKGYVVAAISDYGKNKLIQERAKGNGKETLN